MFVEAVYRVPEERHELNVVPTELDSFVLYFCKHFAADGVKYPAYYFFLDKIPQTGAICSHRKKSISFTGLFQREFSVRPRSPEPTKVLRFIVNQPPGRTLFALLQI
jgi:hypothetical protein